MIVQKYCYCTIFGIVLCLAILPQPSSAQPTAFTPAGYTIEQEVLLPVSPGTAFDIMTGDITPWWDHSMSENPQAMYIEPSPGGSFMEIFDDNGNGVRHAVVTYADRGKLLRFEGPLGLSGRAITMVTTWEFAVIESGTRVSCTCNISGQIDDEWAAAVQGVWYHFLVEQLLPYVESGEWE